MNFIKHKSITRCYKLLNKLYKLPKQFLFSPPFFSSFLRGLNTTLGCWQILDYCVTFNSMPFLQRSTHVYIWRFGVPSPCHLQTPFRQVPLAPMMQDYNEAMSALRISVEWLFGDAINSFKFLDFKKNLKIGLSSVGKMYAVCALLRNAITCLYGNSTSDYFGIEPPTLEQYFQ